MSTGSVSRQRWREIIEDAVTEELDRLGSISRDNPAVYAELQKLSVQVLDECEDEDDAVLGWYLGVPVTEPWSEPGQLPPLIQMFVVPLADVATDADRADIEPDPAELRRQAVITLRHEIAHHFGIDHDRLHTLGLD